MTLNELIKLTGKSRRQIINRRNALGILGKRIWNGNKFHLEFSAEEAARIVDYMRPKEKAASGKD